MPSLIEGFLDPGKRGNEGKTGNQSGSKRMASWHVSGSSRRCFSLHTHGLVSEKEHKDLAALCCNALRNMPPCNCSRVGDPFLSCSSFFNQKGEGIAAFSGLGDVDGMPAQTLSLHVLEAFRNRPAQVVCTSICGL